MAPSRVKPWQAQLQRGVTIAITAHGIADTSHTSICEGLLKVGFIHPRLTHRLFTFLGNDPPFSSTRPTTPGPSFGGLAWFGCPARPSPFGFKRNPQTADNHPIGQKNHDMAHTFRPGQGGTVAILGCRLSNVPLPSKQAKQPLVSQFREMSIDAPSKSRDNR